MKDINRRDFLASGVALGGAALLGGCGSSGSSSSAQKTTPVSSRPPISKEPGKLSILEWGGYEAGGTPAQTSGLWAGTDYTKATASTRSSTRTSSMTTSR